MTCFLGTRLLTSLDVKEEVKLLFLPFSPHSRTLPPRDIHLIDTIAVPSKILLWRARRRAPADIRLDSCLILRPVEVRETEGCIEAPAKSGSSGSVTGNRRLKSRSGDEIMYIRGVEEGRDWR